MSDSESPEITAASVEAAAFVLNSAVLTAVANAGRQAVVLGATDEGRALARKCVLDLAEILQAAANACLELHESLIAIQAAVDAAKVN
jgi:hypothetical protein